MVRLWLDRGNRRIVRRTLINPERTKAQTPLAARWRRFSVLPPLSPLRHVKSAPTVTLAMPAAVPFITKDNARQLAILSHAPNSKRFVPAPPVIATPVQIIMQPASPSQSAELLRVCRRLDQLNAAMDKPKLDPKQWDMLTRAYDRVFKAWMVLSGTPGSGQRKPPAIRQGRAVGYPQPEPIPEPIPVEPAATPAPQPIASCGVPPAPTPAPAPQAPEPAS